MNLYLPETLKAEIDQVEGINWSSVAQEAFRSAITARKASTMDTTAIAERLKGTAGKNSARYKQGFEEGKRFAAESAEIDDLEFLHGYEPDVMVSGFEMDHVGADLAAKLDCDLDFLFEADEKGGIRLTESRVRGFVDGANEVYAKVRSSL